MQIQKVSVREINPAAYNPRIDLAPGDPDYEMLKKSISTFGLVEPLVWNRQTGNLVGGHQRLKILKEEGVAEVEVSVVDLSLDQEKALNLALNKIQGDWDEDKLSALVDELSKIPDFDFGLTGFEAPEVSQILDRSEEIGEDYFDFGVAVGAIEEPVTKEGDVIELGPHRIMCGDSASEADLDTLMRAEKADLVQTDPPYGCRYLAQNRPDLEPRLKKSKRWEKLYKDDLSEKEYEEWMRGVLANLRRFLKDGASAYVWSGHAKFYFVHQVLRELGFHVSTVITWAKPTFAISYGDFNQQTEFCLYAWLKNGPHKWYGSTSETNLWEIKRDKARELIHPTQKPIEIPARAIRNSSRRGDIVVDLFLGSGSTLLAAECLGRRCFGMEIEPKYVDAIVRRYGAFVGEDKIEEKIRAKYFSGVANGR